jgi:hypothetical protein
MEVDLNKNLSKNLLTLLDEGIGCDVKFSVQGKILAAHRNILAISPIFKAQLYGDSKKDLLELKLNVSFEAFRAFIRILYGEQIVIPQDQLLDILQLAHEYQVEDLLARCKFFL